MSQFNFNISLSVLNHLGRNLYRSVITIIGEAVSNSWDADAKNVWIEVDKENNNFVIIDDGIGMTNYDFQNKFLKIGYTKRKDGNSKSPENRPYIGRKGIGKLALLSCATRVHILTKTKYSDYIGGIIDNNQLDEDIKDDLNAQDSKLKDVEDNIFSKYKENHKEKKGTIIYFEGINNGIRNKLDYIKILIALYFRFSLIDNDFNIFFNGDKITANELKYLADDTQFLWSINQIKDPYIDMLKNIVGQKADITPNLDLDIKGFIASVNKPSNLNIRTTDEKTGIDLFVNGRLREKNILHHMSDFVTRHIASYLYGQVHFNQLDDNEDRFTTAREGIKDGDKMYEKLLNGLKSEILEQVSKQWNEWRNELKKIKPKDESIPNFNLFTHSKQQAINKFLGINEGEDLKEKAKEMIKTISPQKITEQKVLITHASQNKEQADIVYNLLLFCGFNVEEILYTSSDNAESRVPVNTNTLKYIKKFFVNDWYEKPYVFFIASQDMANSWYACLEVGGFWIVGNEHNIATIGNYCPQLPLNPDNYKYLIFDNKNNCNESDLCEIFQHLVNKFNKNTFNQEDFLNYFNEITNKE